MFLIVGFSGWAIIAHLMFKRIFYAESEQIGKVIASQFRTEVSLNNYELAVRSLNELEKGRLITCPKVVLNNFETEVVILDRSGPSNCASSLRLTPFLAHESFEAVSLSGQLYRLSYNYLASTGLQVGYLVTLLSGFLMSIGGLFAFSQRERFLNQVGLEKMRAAEKIEAQAQQVAHDIRSPLTALRAAVQLAEESTSDSTREIIEKAAHRIENIARDILEQARLKKSGTYPTFEGSEGKGASQPESKEFSRGGKLVEINLKNLIGNLVREMNLAYPSKIAANLPEFDIIVFGIETEIERVLSNLIINALQSIGDGDRVIVTLDSQDNMALIEVRDRGRGIPPDVLPHIFNKGFSYGKDDGTGLGLFHAKMTIESCGGKINAKSLVGRGTTLSISLPLAMVRSDSG